MDTKKAEHTTKQAVTKTNLLKIKKLKHHINQTSDNVSKVTKLLLEAIPSQEIESLKANITQESQVGIFHEDAHHISKIIDKLNEHGPILTLGLSIILLQPRLTYDLWQPTHTLTVVVRDTHNG